MAYSVVQDDEVAIGVERLILAEQYAGEPVHEEAVPAPARAVQDEHRVGDTAVLVAPGFAERGEVNPQLRQRFARGEMEIGDDVIALDGLECGRRRGADRRVGKEGGRRG